MASNMYVACAYGIFKRILTFNCRISSVTSFHHLKSLESLDISRNNIDSLRRESY